MYFLDGQLLSIYGLQNTVLLPTSTLLCTLKTVTYPSHQIIKVCNSTTIVFNTLYLNVKTFFMNEYMFDGDLRSYKATTVILEMMINKQNQNSISSLIPGNQGAHEGINSLHLSVENDSEVMSCYYQLVNLHSSEKNFKTIK